MSANLPPQFYTISAKLKEVKTSEEKISILEELLAIVPKHKGTEKVQRDIKTKIAKLRRQKPKKGKREDLYSIKKEGAGQIVIVGPANSGKSSLLNALTKANAKVAPYSFTTEIPQPAMMPYENILIQLVDTPPLSKSSPPWLKGILKAADGLLAVFDLSPKNVVEETKASSSPFASARVVEDIENLQELLNNWGITDKKILFLGNKVDELFSSPTLRSARAIDLAKLRENLKKIESQYKIKIISCLEGIGVDEAVASSSLFANAWVVDEAVASSSLFANAWVVDEAVASSSPSPAKAGLVIKELKKEIFDLLEIVRVYTKASNKSSPDFEHPFILKKNSRLIELASQIHRDFFFSFRYAKLFKKNSKKPQFVGKDYLLQDEDIIEIHI